MKTKIAILGALLVVAVGIWWKTPAKLQYKGITMGTTYSVTAFAPRYLKQKDLGIKIEARLNIYAASPISQAGIAPMLRHFTRHNCPIPA